jgi:UDP-N-acetylglucosamine acyltransferase
LIHPAAIVDPEAIIADDVMIGPYAVIGADVEIGAACNIGSHVHISGRVKMGRDNRIYPFAAIGGDPQDKKYGNEPTRLEIGNGNTIREYVTINRGTVQDTGVTRIGNENWIMAYVHIAHDCLLGNHTIMANNATLAGHVRVDDYAVLGGATLVHQFCRIGEQAFTAYGARINKDVPPFVLVCEGRARPRGINVEGLKRRGYDDRTIQLLKDAYRLLYRADLSLDEAVARFRGMEEDCEPLRRMRLFIEQSQRSIIR